MAKSDSVGRYLVATRPIQAHEIVLVDPPLIIAPQSQPICLVCLGPIDFHHKCTKCDMPMCSKECECKHPEKEECVWLSRMMRARTIDIKAGHSNLVRDDGNRKVRNNLFIFDVYMYAQVYSSVAVIRLLLTKASLKPPLNAEWINQLMDHRVELFKVINMWHHQRLSPCWKEVSGRPLGRRACLLSLAFIRFKDYFYGLRELTNGLVSSSLI